MVLYYNEFFVFDCLKFNGCKFYCYACQGLFEDVAFCESFCWVKFEYASFNLSKF